MIKTVPFKNSTIRYSDSGKGDIVVLLHGYLESLEIWDSFQQKLTNKYRVICPDLPGHGKSGIIGHLHSMEKLAEGVVCLLDHLKIDNCFLVGHSMGGYTGLALLENYPEKLNGLCLFHSHPYPDTEQVKTNRNREIDLVKQGKKELISRINIPKAFSPGNRDKFGPEIERATTIALNTPDEGIIACLRGMMVRPSRVQLLKEAGIPVLLIAGRHDCYISWQDIAAKIALPAKSGFTTLENSGHIGFIEEPGKSAETISAFAENCIK